MARNNSFRDTSQKPKVPRPGGLGPGNSDFAVQRQIDGHDTYGTRREEDGEVYYDHANCSYPNADEDGMY